MVKFRPRSANDRTKVRSSQVRILGVAEVLVLASLLIPLLSPPPRARAGPNEGGVIILHAQENIRVVNTNGSYRGLSSLPACEAAVTRVDHDGPVIFYVLAAFPTSHHPRMAGVVLGIDYDPSRLELRQYGMSGDFTWSDDDWPLPETGTAVTWNQAQTSHVTEIYWFLGYRYTQPTAPFSVPSPRPTQFVLTPHSTQGGCFVEDSPFGELDPIAGYGRLGFFMEGALPCPGVKAGSFTPDLSGDRDPTEPMRSWGAIKTIFR